MNSSPIGDVASPSECDNSSSEDEFSDQSIEDEEEDPAFGDGVLRAQRVLVADCMKSVRETMTVCKLHVLRFSSQWCLVQMQLQYKGYRVCSCSDGVQALRLLKAHQFQVQGVHS